MEMNNLCCCCLLLPPDRDLRTPYTLLGITEIYSDMLEGCFQILITMGHNGECGICEECVGRLRDARDFKVQVQRSQAELQARLERAPRVEEEMDLVKSQISHEVDNEEIGEAIMLVSQLMNDEPHDQRVLEEPTEPEGHKEPSAKIEPDKINPESENNVEEHKTTLPVLTYSMNEDSVESRIDTKSRNRSRQQREISLDSEMESSHECMPPSDETSPNVKDEVETCSLNVPNETDSSDVESSLILQCYVPATDDITVPTSDDEKSNPGANKLHELSNGIEKEETTRRFPTYTSPAYPSIISKVLTHKEHLKSRSLSPGLQCTRNDNESSVGSTPQCYDSDSDATIDPEFEKSSSSGDEETTEDLEHADQTYKQTKESQASTTTSINKTKKHRHKVKKSSCESSNEQTINNSNSEEQLEMSEEHQVQTSSTAADECQQKSARIRTKDFCFFCQTSVLNFARHVFRNHTLEVEVQKILSYPKKSFTRKTLLTNLRKKGNYIANVSKCIKPMKKSGNNDYLPCENCLGFYSRKQLWKHKKSCQPMSNTSHSQVDAQSFMLRNLKVDKKLKEEVFCKMRPDRVSLEAKQDTLICAFGAQYLRTHREKNYINVTSRKMRELAKLLIELKKLIPGLNDLMDSLKPQNYDTIVTATKTVASYDDKLDRYGVPTYAMNIRNSLKQCCNIAIIMLKSVTTVQTASMQADVQTLNQLIEANWKSDVSNQACSDLIEKKNKVTKVPLASDLKLARSNANTPNTPSVLTAKKKRNLIPWTSEQKKNVLDFFSKHIKTKRPPKRHECDELRRLYPEVFHNKDWLKIKVFVQNMYTNKR